MAKGRKTGGRDFKPGDSGGPGRPVTPPELRVLRQITKTEFRRVATGLLNASPEELAAWCNGDGIPGFERAIAAILAKSIEFGDTNRLEFFLNRLIGKPKDEVEVTAKPFIVKRPSGEELAMGAKPGGGDTSDEDAS